MIATPAIRNLIREGKAHQITTAMQSAGEPGHGHLRPPPRRSATPPVTITKTTALEFAHAPDEFARLARL